MFLSLCQTSSAKLFTSKHSNKLQRVFIETRRAFPKRTFFSKSVVYKSIYKIVKLYNLNCYHALITSHIITEQCGTKQNLPLKMVPVNPLAHGLSHFLPNNNDLIGYYNGLKITPEIKKMENHHSGN